MRTTTKLEDVQITAYLFSALTSVGLFTLGEVANHTFTEMMNLMGSRDLASKVQKFLQTHGIKFNPEIIDEGYYWVKAFPYSDWNMYYYNGESWLSFIVEERRLIVPHLIGPRIIKPIK